MKKIIFIALTISSFQTLAIDTFEGHGYFKTSVAQSKDGGKHKCINNSGAKGNEFRLGNECGQYGEINFNLNYEDSKADTSSLFSIHTTFAYYGNNYTQYGDDNTNDIDAIEGYVSVNPDKTKSKRYWIGKRFYRDADVMMNDFFYFAAMSSTGAGIENIEFLDSRLSLALLQQGITSDSKNTAYKNYFDIRLFDLHVVNNHYINLWTSYAKAPATSIDSDKYEDLNGHLFGFRFRSNLSKGFNDFTVIYGKALLSSLDVYGSNKIETNVDNDSKNITRVVEYLVYKINPKLEYSFASTLELRDTGFKKSTWFNIGIRPKYFLDDHNSIIFEAGHSEVNDDAYRTLNRYTIAHEYGLRQSIFSQMALRTFISYSSWNEKNNEKFDNKPDHYNIGFQAEASL